MELQDPMSPPTVSAPKKNHGWKIIILVLLAIVALWLISAEEPQEQVTRSQDNGNPVPTLTATPESLIIYGDGETATTDEGLTLDELLSNPLDTTTLALDHILGKSVEELAEIQARVTYELAKTKGFVHDFEGLKQSLLQGALNRSYQEEGMECPIPEPCIEAGYDDFPRCWLYLSIKPSTDVGHDPKPDWFTCYPK